MSKIKDLIKELPKIAKVNDAERYSERNLLLFAVEKSDKLGQGVFAHKKSDTKTPRQRLKVLEIPREEIGDIAAYEFGMDLLAFNALCHRSNKHELTNKEIDQKAKLKESLLAQSGRTESIQEIESIVSIEIAERGWWYD